MSQPARRLSNKEKKKSVLLQPKDSTRKPCTCPTAPHAAGSTAPDMNMFLMVLAAGRFHAGKKTVLMSCGPNDQRGHAYQGMEKNKRRPQPHVFMYSMRSARSFSFFMPAKTILVPGMYFFGLTKYSNMCLSDHTIPEFLFASEYAKPSSVPDWRPKTPHRGGH